MKRRRIQRGAYPSSTGAITFLIFAALGLSSCSLPQSPRTPLPEPAARGLTLADAGGNLEIALDQPLSGDALAAIAVLTNPDLRALRAREGVAEAQVFAAGLYPDPSFSLGIDLPLNGVGVVTALAGALGIDLAAWARRPAAVRGARANLEAVRLDIAWAEWLTGEQARLLAVRVAYLERIRGLSGELRRLAEDELSRALVAVTRGDLPAAELVARRLAASDAADRDRGAESQLTTARLELNRVLGVDPAEEVAVAAPPPPRTAIPPAAELFQRAVAGRADLGALRSGYESSAAELDAALLSKYPLPSLDLNAARDTGAINTLGPSVQLTLPLWNRGRGDLAVAQATQAQLRAEYAARLESLRADLAAARGALEIAQRQQAAVARSLEPLLPQAAAAQRAAERGDLARTAATATRMAALDQQIVAAGLEQTVAELDIALEIAVGERLETLP